MKNIFLTRFIFSACAVTMLFFSSCKKGEEITFDKKFTGIYFQTDSLYYSFGVTPLDVQNYTLNVPVKIMGLPASADRTFLAEVVPGKTTAVAGQQYSITEPFVIKKDSINGHIAVKINRAQLGTDDFKILLKLTEKGGFVPVNESFKQTVVFFNNKVERPTWKDFNNKPTWPSQLGVWNPLTYIKFIELFRGIETKAPETYAIMIQLYGKDLANVTYGWAWDYNNTMTKYVLIPLYQYFVEQNPQLGVVIPRPSGY